MKNLKYFETEVQKLREANADYRLTLALPELILNLMKKYRKDNNISFAEYKPVYDKYFNKYHN